MKADERAGERIREERTDRGWTYEDMSAEIFKAFGPTYSTSARTIWRVEAGHRPSVRKQFAIARILELMPSDLWGSSAKARQRS